MPRWLVLHHCDAASAAAARDACDSLSFLPFSWQPDFVVNKVRDSCHFYDITNMYVCMYPLAGVQPTLDPYAEAFIAGPLC